MSDIFFGYIGLSVMKKVNISNKARSAVKDLNNLKSECRLRAENLSGNDENGFALLLYWGRIELSIKLIRYFYKIQDGWPDNLSFINSRWGILSDLKSNNLCYYNATFGKSNSIYSLRNSIVHECVKIDEEKYKKFLPVAIWAASILESSVPSVDSLVRRKRRSDAQIFVVN